MEQIKILVVEDEAITAMDLKKRLQEMGYTVPVIADSGEDAVKVVKEIKPHVILMDVYLKGNVDGVEAAKEISKYYNVPIIFLTSHLDKDSFNRAKSAEPYAFLTKPCGTNDLNNAIEMALYKHKTDLKIAAGKKRYQAIMQNASCGIFLHDENGIIHDVNTVAEKIFGCARDKLINVNFSKFIIESEQYYANTMLQKIIIEKKIGPNLVHIQQPDGKIVDVEFSSVYVEDEDKDESFILSIITDITEQNRMRAQTLLSDKLATIGALSAGLVHEINNPLTWVLTNLTFLKDKVSDMQMSIPAQKELLIEIISESIQGTERIRDLIRNLKGFARIDQDQVTLVDVKKSLKDAIKMAEPQCKNRSKIELNFADDIPFLLMANSKLEQVFLNLIINAAQSIDEKKFETNLISINASKVNNNICIDFTDNGKGIPPDQLSRIFDPFYTTKPVGVGTGLGLSICSDIIHHAGGQITVESKLGEGTKFTVCLPIQFKVANSDESVDPVPESAARKRILVVDDEKALLLVIQRTLGSQHHITVCNGRKALDMLSSAPQNFDAIIADINMPDVSGIDLYRYLSNQHVDLARHFIFTTNECGSAMSRGFIKSTNNICLEKPFTVNQLKQAINQILSV